MLEDNNDDINRQQNGSSKQQALQQLVFVILANESVKLVDNIVSAGHKAL